MSLIGSLCCDSGVCVVKFGSLCRELGRLCRDSGVRVVSRGFVVAETGHRKQLVKCCKYFVRVHHYSLHGDCAWQTYTRAHTIRFRRPRWFFLELGSPILDGV